MSQNPHLPVTGSNQTGNLIATGNKLLQQAKGAYSAKIRRDQPTALVFLIDQSGSMNEGELDIEGVSMNKASATARIINKTLSELINRSTTREIELANYVYVSIIGYGLNGKVDFAWSGKLKGKQWVGIVELNEAAEYVKIVKEKKGPNGTKKLVEYQAKSWIQPIADARTPMLAAMTMATKLVDEWIKNGHQNSYPPVVINITDGEATDATNNELIEAAKNIKQLRTNDGHVLFLNCHLSDVEGKAVIFPDDIGQLPNNSYAKTLYEMSSVMPDVYNDIIQGQLAVAATKSSMRGMSFNTDGSRLIKFLNIGSYSK